MKYRKRDMAIDFIVFFVSTIILDNMGVENIKIRILAMLLVVLAVEIIRAIIKLIIKMYKESRQEKCE